MELRELYYCEHCKNLVEVVQAVAPALVCCGEKMVKLDEKSGDEGKEKHVPVLEQAGSGIKVTVGSVEHPMLEEHYIKFIEVLTTDKVLRKELNPGDKPVAEFNVDIAEVESVREFCTVHGVWKNN